MPPSQTVQWTVARPCVCCWSELVASSRATVEDMVNDYFREKLSGIPEVATFLEELEA